MALIEMELTLQPVIDGPPLSKEQLWEACTRSDGVSVKHWAETWKVQTAENRKRFNFDESSAVLLSGEQAYRPVIIAGSGPSLKKNIEVTKPSQRKNVTVQGEMMDWVGRGDIAIVSCLHNFPYFEDHDIMRDTDYYITIDAGEVAYAEMFEGGEHDAQWYIDRTKSRTLIAHHTTHPKLLDAWKGRIYFISDQSYTPDALKEWLDVTKVPPCQVGGSVLGAATYVSEIILGASELLFVGADFCFDYTKKFHAWPSRYDAMFTGVIPATDIFGNRVWTWPSYNQFNYWLQYQLLGGQGNNLHNWVNCTEGGIFGSWPTGNIIQLRQDTLEMALKIRTRHKLAAYWQKKLILSW